VQSSSGAGDDEDAGADDAADADHDQVERTERAMQLMVAGSTGSGSAGPAGPPRSRRYSAGCLLSTIAAVWRGLIHR